VVTNIKHRFDPKAAYRQNARRASTEEIAEKPEISLDNFRARVFTPGSKAYIASQKENIQRTKANEENDPNHLTFENKRYNPALLDDTQVIVFCLNRVLKAIETFNEFVWKRSKCSKWLT